MMLGNFLEISVHSPDVPESVRFYQRLGFTLIPGNDTWQHAYGVMTDGRCFIGLHAFAFPGPALTFAAPELARRVATLEAAGVNFEFLKLGDDEFHELGFLLPDEQMITLLEARTFSPPNPAELGESLCGWFAEYRLPVVDRDAAAARWQALDFLEGEAPDTLHDSVTVCRTGLNVGLSESRRLRGPSLVFHLPDLAPAAARLTELGIGFDHYQGARGDSLELRAPEGTRLILHAPQSHA